MKRKMLLGIVFIILICMFLLIPQVSYAATEIIFTSADDTNGDGILSEDEVEAKIVAEGETRGTVKSVTIKGVTTIGVEAFLDCVDLKRVTLGDDITTIEEKAFDGCSSLLRIYMLGNAPTIQTNSFSSVPGTIVITKTATGYNSVWKAEAGIPVQIQYFQSNAVLTIYDTNLSTNIIFVYDGILEDPPTDWAGDPVILPTGITYDANTNTITLNGYNSGQIVAINMDVNIVVIGENTITEDLTGMPAIWLIADDYDDSGADTYNGKLNISGNGILNLVHTGTETGYDFGLPFYPYGIASMADINISGATVNINVNSDKSPDYAYGIFTEEGNINIKNDAKVTIMVAGGTKGNYALAAKTVNIYDNATIKEGDGQSNAQTVATLTFTIDGTLNVSKNYVSIIPKVILPDLEKTGGNEILTMLYIITGILLAGAGTVIYKIRKK